MKKGLLSLGVFAVSTLLFSCIGVDSTVSFNRDGSGTMLLEYRISKMLTEMGEGDSEAPLPLSEDEMKAAIESNPNLELKRVSQREDDQDVYITAEVGFKNIDDVTEVETFQDMPMSLEKSGGEYTYRQLISEGQSAEEQGEQQEMDAETKAMMAQFFEGYELSFTVKAPSTVTFHSMGELSADRKSVSYSIPLLDMNSLTEETVLEVKWRS